MANRFVVSPLLFALDRRSTAEVQRALAADPQAADEPFFEHNCEPPLCAAIRLRCNTQIVEILVTHGADIDALNVHSRTPLQELRSLPEPIGLTALRAHQTWRAEVEILLARRNVELVS